jgi:hypothetical protein
MRISANVTGDFGNVTDDFGHGERRSRGGLRSQVKCIGKGSGDQRMAVSVDRWKEREEAVASAVVARWRRVNGGRSPARSAHH